jgi:hypothetical protein
MKVRMDSATPERARRALATVIQWGGWLYSLSIFIWATIEYDPSKMNFAPQWVGLSFILGIGFAIAGTTARSRMRLSDTIVTALQTGIEAQRVAHNLKIAQRAERAAEREEDNNMR